MICIARTFGAPDTVPAGKHDTSASSRSRSSASLPSTIDVRCMTCENFSRPMNWGTRLDPLRQHDLINFARGYALFSRTDLLLETLACVIGANLEAVPARGRGTRETALEFALEEPDFRAGKLIERLEVVVRGDPGVRN